MYTTMPYTNPFLMTLHISIEDCIALTILYTALGEGIVFETRQPAGYFSLF